MERSVMIVQTAWQNALYTNPIDYSPILKLLDHFILYTEKHFDNNAWNMDHMAIVNAREL